MKFFKSLFLSLFGLMLVAGLAMANCGMDHDKGCPMHKEKNQVLTDASKALEQSNPELSGKLKDMADNCCGSEHKH
jgi:hypothetical protein